MSTINYIPNSNIVYGNIVINYNHSFVDSIFKMMYDSEMPHEYSDIIVEFNNHNVVKINKDVNANTNKNTLFIYSEIKYSTLHCPQNMVNIQTNEKYRYLQPEFDDKIKQYKMQFTKIFPNINISMTQGSIYNCAYTKLTKDAKMIPVLGICKNKYGFDMERYILAYDKEEFNEEQLCEIISHLFFKIK